MTYFFARMHLTVMAGLVEGVNKVDNRVKVDPSLFLKRVIVKAVP